MLMRKPQRIRLVVEEVYFFFFLIQTLKLIFALIY